MTRDGGKEDKSPREASAVPETRVSRQDAPVSEPTLAAGAAPVSGLDETVAPSSVPAADGSVPPARVVVEKQDYDKLAPVDPRHYVVGKELAKGGMGRILIARDRRLGREVALKELLYADQALRVRFEREARITAKLQHPSIVSIHEAGTWPTGEPFYAMKLVAGRAFDQVIAGAKTLADRLALLPNVLAAADALAFAHSHRVIHRDLKPGNILVGEYGETVVIDWGLAKDLADTSVVGDVSVGPYRTPATAPGETVVGAVMGTPAYMPPEQARGETVDERADVYALGAILYHVLVGEAPYQGRTIDELLANVMAGPPEPLERRAPGAPADLMTIAGKAMAHRAEERYPTAHALADDLRRFQTGQLVGAHRYSLGQLVQRFVRRHRATVFASTALLLILAAGAIVSVRRIVGERNTADRERRIARAAETDAESKRVAANAAEARATQRSDELTLLQAKASIETDPTLTLAFLKSLGPSFTRWASARLIAVDALARGVAARVDLYAGDVHGVSVTPDGKFYATALDDKVLVTELATGRVRTFAGAVGEVYYLTFSPDGATLVTAGTEPVVRLWDVATGTARVLTGHTARLYVIAVSPDGKRVASGGGDGTVRLWDLATGEGRVVGEGMKNPRRLAFSPDQTRLAVGTDLDVRVLDLTNPAAKPLVFPRKGMVLGVAISPDGRWLASGTRSVYHVMLVDLQTGTERTLRDKAEKDGESLFGNGQVTFSADGLLVAAAGDDGAVRVWDVARGQLRTLAATISQTRQAQWIGPRELVACGDDTDCTLWDVEAGAVIGRLRGHTAPIRWIDLSRDQRLLVTGGGHSTRLWRLPEPRRRRWSLSGGDSVRFSPDGTTLVAAGDDGTFTWDLARNVRTKVLDGGRSAMFSPDGARLASVQNHEVALLDLRTGAKQVLSGPTANLWRMAWSHDGKVLAASGEDVDVWLWDLSTGESRTLKGHTELVYGLAFSPDDRQLASAGYDTSLRLWDLATGTSQVVKMRAGLFNVAFSPDGKTIAAGSNDAVLHLFDITAGLLLDERRDLTGHSGNTYGAAYGPTNDEAATASADGTVRVWDLASGASERLASHGKVYDVTFSPDGRWVAAAGAEGVQIWDLAVPHDGPSVREWLATTTNAILGPTNELAVAP